MDDFLWCLAACQTITILYAYDLSVEPHTYIYNPF